MTTCSPDLQVAPPTGDQPESVPPQQACDVIERMYLNATEYINVYRNDNCLMQEWVNGTHIVLSAWRKRHGIGMHWVFNKPVQGAWGKVADSSRSAHLILSQLMGESK